MKIDVLGTWYDVENIITTEDKPAQVDVDVKNKRISIYTHEREADWRVYLAHVDEKRQLAVSKRNAVLVAFAHEQNRFLESLDAGSMKDMEIFAANFREICAAYRLLDCL